MNLRLLHRDRGISCRSLLACCLLVAVVFCGATAATRAMSLVRAESLGALVDESRRCVLAQVIGVRYGYDDNRLPGTFVTLRVEDAVYGDELPAPGETLEIKLYGAPVEMDDGLRIHVDGTPRYRAGERYLLLLLGDSKWGFTNTAGLMFGAFRVEEDAAGRRMASSVGGNRWSFGERGLAGWLREPSELERGVLADPRAPVPYPLLRRALIELKSGAGVPR